MKLNQILNIASALDKLKDQTVTFPVAFKIYKLGTKVSEATAFYQEQFLKIIHQYGQLDEQGQPIPGDEPGTFRLQPDKQQECVLAMQDLMNVDIDCPYTFTPDELALVQLSPQDIAAFEPFIP